MRNRAEIRARRAEGEPIKAIARRIGASRNTVRRALAPGARDHYHRSSATEDAEEAVRDVLADWPHMAVVDIGALIDWRLSRRTLSNLVAALRPEYAERTDTRARPISTIRAGRIAARALTVGTVVLQ
ncbi:helix-turn-helix domain-containing protein [Oerskovia sp. NPDC057915]|uniref:helix-turn-helix domain-containing protein n=1 Tax=Oerskovia sp. NPDC057915 TaxID=3346280 RepID=UPI0036D7C787